MKKVLFLTFVVDQCYGDNRWNIPMILNISTNPTISNRIRQNLHRPVFRSRHHQPRRNSPFHPHLVLKHFFFKILFPVENVKISLHLPVVVIPVSPIVNPRHIIIIIIIEVLIFLLNVIHVYPTFVPYVHHRIRTKNPISPFRITREENLFQRSFPNWMVLVESNLNYPSRVIVHLHNSWRTISNRIVSRTGKEIFQSGHVSDTSIRDILNKSIIS